jgi:hypothetical protein
MPARGCGEARQQGAVYLECRPQKDGVPLSEFLIDPPVPVPDGLGLSPIGIHPFPKDSMCERCNGSGENPDHRYYDYPGECIYCKGTGRRTVTHVLDWVGQGTSPAGPGYWNVADFVEECKRFGSSRKVPRTFDFSVLTQESRQLFVHARAYVEDWGYWDDWRCPKNLEGHDHDAFDVVLVRPCLGICWHDVEGALPTTVDEGEEPPYYLRHMPSFAYTCQPRPHNEPVQYRPAIFLSLPISHVAVVQAEDGSHKDTLARVQALTEGKLPCEEVDQ